MTTNEVIDHLALSDRILNLQTRITYLKLRDPKEANSILDRIEKRLDFSEKVKEAK